jgi:hypothetical protein
MAALRRQLRRREMLSTRRPDDGHGSTTMKSKLAHARRGDSSVIASPGRDSHGRRRELKVGPTACVRGRGTKTTVLHTASGGSGKTRPLIARGRTSWRPEGNTAYGAWTRTGMQGINLFRSTRRRYTSAPGWRSKRLAETKEARGRGVDGEISRASAQDRCAICAVNGAYYGLNVLLARLVVEIFGTPFYVSLSVSSWFCLIQSSHTTITTGGM